MTSPEMSLRPAETEGLDRVESLLEANDLPSDDVRTKPDCFFVAESKGVVVGVGGVETRGSAGLLRSVVVREASRGEGYGRVLCDALEDRARAEGVETLYLLTTTAAAFFRRNGYETIQREEAPAGIRGTAQFADLCPDSATAMRKGIQDA
jgi:amino-acid N-acetyltransferase